MHAAFRISYEASIILSKAARAVVLTTCVLTGHLMLKLRVLLVLLSSFRQTPKTLPEIRSWRISPPFQFVTH
jgi:hypothetical protein